MDFVEFSVLLLPFQLLFFPFAGVLLFLLIPFAVLLFPFEMVLLFLLILFPALFLQFPLARQSVITQFLQ